MPNPLCHFEFTASDEARSRQFLTSVFDWKFDGSSMPGYTLINTGSEPGGGLMKVTPEMPGPCFTVYFLVDDIPATLQKVEQAGGKVLVPQTPIPNVGEFAIIADPDGLHLGIYRSAH
ncbi:MAG: VOC family protein [Planctomycetes bacterium]|nr:VOC family protein [Planctomycetota bacterium]